MTRWWPLALLLCVLTALVSSRDASAWSGVQPENRVRGFDLVIPALVGLGVAHLGVSTLFPGGALISVWETASDGTSRATTDVNLDFRPSPFVFLPSGDAD